MSEQPDQTQQPDPSPPHEEIDGVVTTDPGAQQAPSQGEQAPEELGTRPPEDPDGEPGFA